MADEDVAFKESLLNTLAGTLSVNHQERVYSEDQLKIFETAEGAARPFTFSFALCLGQHLLTLSISISNLAGCEMLHFMSNRIHL